jgi:predicted transcriptional regulator of viral defense system
MTQTTARVRELFRQRGPLRSHELEQHGISRVQLSRMVAAGHLKQVARGLYALASYQPSEHAALVTVARRAPDAVFCLLTALRLHDLTTQAPFEVWIAIGNKAHAPKMIYPPLRVIRFSDATLTQGVEARVVDGVTLRTTNVAKTVADCFKFRNKIGLDVALEALREARRDKRATNDELWRYAKLCRVATVMRPYLEAVA